MSINATLFGQMLTFALFVWFTMKFVWPPVMRALQERQDKIADGLAAAERGQQELKLAQEKATQQIRDAKDQAAEIIDHANLRAGHVVEESKIQARKEARHIIEQAHAEIVQEVNQAKEALRQQVAAIAISGAEKILERNIDEAANNELLQKLIEEI